MTDAKLLAVSDLHVGHRVNRLIVERLQPQSEHDWLLVAGDIGELAADVEWTLRVLSERFAKVVWAPGNHELWTHDADPVRLRGEPRYQHLVGLAQGLGVITPEDPYPAWEGPGGPAVIAPLFLLYDYSFLPRGRHRRAAAAPGPVPQPRGLVPGPGGSDRAPPRGTRAGHPHDPGEPFPA